MRISDWSSDVCSSDLAPDVEGQGGLGAAQKEGDDELVQRDGEGDQQAGQDAGRHDRQGDAKEGRRRPLAEIERSLLQAAVEARSEERRVGKGGVSTCRSRWAPYH